MHEKKIKIHAVFYFNQQINESVLVFGLWLLVFGL